VTRRDDPVDKHAVNEPRRTRRSVRVAPSIANPASSNDPVTLPDSLLVSSTKPESTTSSEAWVASRKANMP